MTPLTGDEKVIYIVAKEIHKKCKSEDVCGKGWKWKQY